MYNAVGLDLLASSVELDLIVCVSSVGLDLPVGIFSVGLNLPVSSVGTLHIQ